MARKNNDDELKEGVIRVDIKNDIISGTPYELENVISNIYSAVEEVEAIADFIDFTDLSITIKRGRKGDVVNFALNISATIIGDMGEVYEEIDIDDMNAENFLDMIGKLLSKQVEYIDEDEDDDEEDDETTY